MGAQGARQVESGAILGIDAFDLDPCATAENSKARSHIDRLRDGTTGNWWGHVFLNSPFSRSLGACRPECGRKSCVKRGRHLDEPQHGAIDFAKTAVRELEAAWVREAPVKAIAWHGPVAPDTDWYAMLWPWVHLRIDYNGRIPYNDSDAGGTFPSQTLILKPTKRTTEEVPTLLRPIPSFGIQGGVKHD